MSLAGRALDFWNDLRGFRPPAPPVDYQPELPPLDSPDMDQPEDAGPPAWAAESITGRSIVIEYTDSKGQRSQRQVVCRRLEEKAGALYLFAVCLLRDRLRNFRADRIVAVIDPESGEVFEPGMAFLGAFAPNSVTPAPFRYGLSPVQFADFNAALNVLAFMARCDGDWHPLEAESIERFAASYWLRAEIPAPFDGEEIARHAARLAPDAEMFWVALSRCAEHPVLSQIIRRHIADVIDADGQHHPRELYWGREIDDLLSTG